MSLKKSPFFEIRSGSVDTLLCVVKTTDLAALRDELIRRFEATPEFFANDVVVIDVRRLETDEQIALDELAALLSGVRLRPMGVVAHPAQHGWVQASGLSLLDARDKRSATRANADHAADSTDNVPAAPEAPASTASAQGAQQSQGPAAEPAARVVPAAPPTMVIDRPLRSGQQIYAPGDLVVLGLVSNGAEVIAAGNIHIYAPLRGRALAGVHGNHEARIFCTCLEPELISIAGIYRTTENPLAPELLGKPVQISLDQEKLIFEPLKLT
jgi:septum site-determining protein MinC